MLHEVPPQHMKECCRPGQGERTCRLFVRRSYTERSNVIKVPLDGDFTRETLPGTNIPIRPEPFTIADGCAHGVDISFIPVNTLLTRQNCSGPPHFLKRMDDVTPSKR